MAKKTVATLHEGSKDGRAYTKVIKTVKSPKTGIDRKNIAKIILTVILICHIFSKAQVIGVLLVESSMITFFH